MRHALAAAALICLLPVITGGHGAPKSQTTDLLVAAANGNLVDVMRRVQAGQDIHARSGAGQSVLSVATMNRHHAVMRYALRQKVDVDARDVSGYTPLHIAALNGDLQAGAILISAGASPRTYTKKCSNALEYAAGVGNRTFFEWLKPFTDKAPLPDDGTAQECELKKESVRFEQARTGFHDRSLRIDYPDDYAPARLSMLYLQSQPDFGKRFIPRLITLLDRPSLPEVARDGSIDRAHRLDVAQTLATVGRSKESKDLIAKKLMRIVERGACPVFQANSCTQTVLDACQGKQATDQLTSIVRVILGGKRQPRSSQPQPDETQCMDCVLCKSSRVGHAFEASLGWFQTAPEYRPRVESVLKKQLDSQTLPKADYLRFRALLKPRKR